MTFRTSDILIGGSLIIIGLTEVAHLAGCLLGWSFLTVTDLVLAEVVIFLLAVALLKWICGRRAKQMAADRRHETHGAWENNGGTAGTAAKSARIRTGVLTFLILLQILGILTGRRVWLDGDMTLETVNTFLKENAIYTVNPLTGAAYTAGMPLRLRILCLPTLYGSLSRWTGMAAADVVYRLIPCVTLLLGYAAYDRLGEAVFGEDKTKRKIFLLAVGILFSAGAYMPGVDGFDLFYGGFRGVTIRAVVLIPYLIACLMEKKYVGVLLCVLAEACMVWTLYGAGVCLLITVGWIMLHRLFWLLSGRHKKEAAE